MTHKIELSTSSSDAIIKALGNLAALHPHPSARSVDRVRLDGAERQRASGKGAELAKWTWGDDTR